MLFFMLLMNARRYAVFASVLGILSLSAFLSRSVPVGSAANLPSCYDPRDYGALTVDESPGFDSRPAFEAALAAIPASGGTLCVPSGRFRVTRAPAGSYNRLAGISLHRCNVSLRGAGENSTTIEMSGDQGNGAAYVIALDPGACNIQISDLAIDTSGMTNTDEQTHAIGVGTGVCSSTNGTCSMPVADVTIEKVRFIHPRPAAALGERKGDCIRLLGGFASTPVLRTKIIGNTFSSCARSSIALQRNVDGLTLIGNHFAAPGIDQQVDGEATGGEWDHSLVMIGNTFDDSSDAQGDLAVAISSQARAVVQGNIFNGRGLGIYRATDLVVDGNVFDATHKGTGGTIAIGNEVKRAVISGNVITRKGAPGPIIRILPQSGGMASDITVAGNIIKNETDGSSIYVQGGTNVTVSENSISGNGGPNSVGIEILSSPRAADAISISGNRVSGTSYAGVRLKGSTYGFGQVSLFGNQVSGSARGLLCEGQGPSVIGMVSAANAWGSSYCAFPIGPGQ